MEDALVHHTMVIVGYIITVLILVLMEDALVHHRYSSQAVRKDLS